jgi:hypothetical protein
MDLWLLPDGSLARSRVNRQGIGRGRLFLWWRPPLRTSRLLAVRVCRWILGGLFGNSTQTSSSRSDSEADPQVADG